MRLWRLSLFAVALSFLVPGGISAQAQQRGPQVIYAQDELPDGETPGVVPDQQEASTEFQKQVVFFRTNEPPGTLIVHTSERFLYLVLGNNKALRYGVGVGKPGFMWSGVKTISAKREWPDWTPPAQMLRRRPDLPRHMKGGVDNPLGARAMYLGGSLYRIHGSNEPETIGQAVSSGCFRMTNEDVVDLYNRVSVGTTVVVKN